MGPSLFSTAQSSSCSSILGVRPPRGSTLNRTVQKGMYPRQTFKNHGPRQSNGLPTIASGGNNVWESCNMQVLLKGNQGLQAVGQLL